MTKLEFMKELESLLLDIPLEEREEALQYYNGYFDDAGEDHEEEVIKELGTPSRVASMIKADLNPNTEDRESRGYFTEKGYQETIKNEYEIVGAAKNTTNNNEHMNNAAGSNQPGSNYNTNAGYQSSNGNGTNAYTEYIKNNNTNNRYNNNTYTNGTYSNGSNTNRANTNGAYTNGANSNGYAGNTNNTTDQRAKNSNTGIIVLVAILTFPFWLPLLISAFGVVIGVVAAILGIIFGFGVAGITMICVGIALFVAGFVQLSIPFFGLLLIGGGLIVFGIGMLLTLTCIALCKNVLPAIIKGVVNFCRLPFQKRSVMA